MTLPIRNFVATGAAISALFLAGCSGTSPAPNQPASTTPAANAAVALYPEKGYPLYIVKDASGKLQCDDKKVAATDVKLGGTVSANGNNVKAEKANDSVTLTFDKGNTFVASAIVNGNTPSVVPENGRGTKVTTLTLSASDFGDVTSVTLCGGGM
jgi:hypothetical protein